MRRVARARPVLSDAPARTEHVEQREFVAWFRKTYPAIRILAIPNGSQRSRTTGARLKAEGVVAGVPDLLIPAWNLWVEMKRADGGAVSAAQKDWHRYLESIDHTVLVCAGFLQAKEKVEELVKRGCF
jgi:hypothetical protein